MDSSGDTRVVGRGMLVAAWVLVLALLTWLFDDQIARQFNPNRNPEGQVSTEGGREVTLLRNAQGHYVANGKINGRPVEFLLDTGATDVAVPEKLADELGLPRQGGGFSQTANGVIPVWRSRIDTVSIGPVRLSDVAASILPDQQAPDYVLLGMSFLKRLEMLQRDGTLTLRQLPSMR